MKKLSQERINELTNKTIIDVTNWYHKNNIFDTDCIKEVIELIISSIKNVNNLTDKEIIECLKYYSYSSTYWEGIDSLVTACEERIENVKILDEELENMIVEIIVSSTPADDLLKHGQSIIVLDKNHTDVCQINPDGSKEVKFKVKDTTCKVDKKKYKIRKDV